MRDRNWRTLLRSFFSDLVSFFFLFLLNILQCFSWLFLMKVSFFNYCPSEWCLQFRYKTCSSPSLSLMYLVSEFLIYRVLCFDLVPEGQIHSAMEEPTLYKTLKQFNQLINPSVNQSLQWSKHSMMVTSAGKNVSLQHKNNLKSTFPSWWFCFMLIMILIMSKLYIVWCIRNY